jgi:hypothetical protein
MVAAEVCPSNSFLSVISLLILQYLVSGHLQTIYGAVVGNRVAEKVWYKRYVLFIFIFVAVLTRWVSALFKLVGNF